MTRRIWMQAGVGKLFLLWGFSMLFGLGERAGVHSSLPIYVLSVLNDQYYFIFAVLPVVLFICAGVMDDDTPLVLVRYGSYGRYFFRKWCALSGVLTTLWLGQLATLLLCGSGLSLSGSRWAEGGLWQEAVVLLRAYFPSPWTAVAGCALWLLAGYLLIGLIALWLGHFCRRATAVKLLMALYLLASLCIKLPVMSSPPFVFLTGLNHWVLLLHSLSEPWRLPLTVVTTAVLVGGVAWSVARRRHRQLALPASCGRGPAFYYRRVLFTPKNILIASGAVLLVTAWTWLGGGAPTDSTDWLVRLFAGHGTGYLYPVGLLSLLVMDVLPLWPLGVFCTQVLGERSVFSAVRLRRRSELLSALLQTGLLWLLLYGGLLTLAASSASLLSGFPPDMGLCAAAVGLRLLDVTLQALLLLTALCLSGQAAVGFVFLVLLHFLCVLPISRLPVGLSSLVRLSLPQTEGAVPLLQAAIILAVLSLALILWLYRRGVKMLFARKGA